MSKAIPLFFWSSKVFENKPLENYGDLLSPYIVEQLSGERVAFYNAPKARKKWFTKKYLMAIGSIMTYASKKALVWGCGIISRQDQFQDAQFYAVRGPLSRKRIQDLGYSCPEVYGDPALLLPLYYKPAVQDEEYDLGIIPHYVDFEKAQVLIPSSNNTTVINLLTPNALQTTNELCACKAILSSSLHGLIVAHAYGIPAVWVRFSDKLSGDNVKFEDYFRSVGITPYEGVLITEQLSESYCKTIIEQHVTLPKEGVVSAIQESLIEAFPRFK